MAKATRRSRGRTYQTLRSLVERGLVRERPTAPVEYAPVEPAEIIQLLVVTSRRRASELEAMLEKARSRPAVVARAAGAEPAPQASLMRGRRAAVAETLRLVDAAKHRIWMAGAGGLGSRIRGQKTVMAALQAAADRGVDVAFATLASEAAAANPLPELAGVRLAHLPLGVPLRVNLLVSDETALVVVPLPDDEAPAHGDDFCLRLDGAPLAHSIAAWIEALVQASRGRQRGDPAAARQELLAALQHARSNVSLMGASAWLATAANGEAGFRDAYLRAAQRGVNVRVVTELEPAVWTQIQPLLGPCRVRAAQAVPVWAVIVDEAAAFVGMAGQDGAEVGLIRRSEDALEIHHLAGLFAGFWEAGADLAAPRAQAP